jgi:hypothetical protein
MGVRRRLGRGFFSPRRDPARDGGVQVHDDQTGSCRPRPDSRARYTQVDGSPLAQAEVLDVSNLKHDLLASEAR